MRRSCRGLQELGLTDGRNVRIDTRWAAGNAAERRKYAGGAGCTGAGRHPGIWRHCRGDITPERPHRADRVHPDGRSSGGGLVASLARPGGNATGFTLSITDIGGKWLELLKEIAPARDAGRRSCVNPAISQGIGQFAAIQSVAPSLGLEVSPV